MKKKALVSLICGSLVLSSTSSFYAHAKDDVSINNTISSSNTNNDFFNNVYDQAEPGVEHLEENLPLKELDGTIYGKELLKIKKEVIKEDSAVTIKVHTLVFHEINGMTQQVDETNDEFKYFKNGEIQINNVAINDNESILSPSLPLAKASLASGGRTFLTHYTETSAGKYKLKAFKEPTNWTLDGGKGTPRTKTGVKKGTLLTDFKGLARSVGGARDDIVIACATISAAGIPLVWTNIIGAIAAGGTIGVAALTIHLKSKSAKADMLEAYNLIK